MEGVISAALQEILKLSPFIAALALAVWALWRKNESRDAVIERMTTEHLKATERMAAEHAVLTREVVTAVAHNTVALHRQSEAINGLSDAISQNRSPSRSRSSVP